MSEKQLNTTIVLRNDTKAEWDKVAETATLRVGEIGIESDTGLFKIGKSKEVDGKTVLCTWGELDYANDVPEIDLSTVTNSVQVVDGTVDDLVAGTVVGDMALVRSTISGTTKSHTAYVWNGSAWAAMDGNYNASNVYFDKNIQVTQTVGNVTTSNNAPVDLQFAGKNMEQIWQYLYATEDTEIVITQPSATFSISSDISKEVGSTYSDPVLTITFADGSYNYGSKDAAGNEYKDEVDETAGVEYNNAVFYLSSDPDGSKIVANTKPNGDTLKTKTEQSNDAFTYTYDIGTGTNRVGTTDKSWKFRAYASCPASERFPVTNLGNFLKADGTTTTDVAEAAKNTAEQVAVYLGEKTFKVSGWRGWFEGYKATGSELDVASLTSANIRGLCTSARNGSFSTSMSNVPAGTNQLVFACPTNKINFTLKDDGVTIDSGFKVEQSTPPAPWTVKHTTTTVNDANSENPITYDVFYCNDVGTIATQKLTITYTKK